jgi:hypothetical protein
MAVARPDYVEAHVPLAAPAGRVEQHLQVVGVMWCLHGGLRLLQGLVAMVVLGTLTQLNFDDSWLFGERAPLFVLRLAPWTRMFLPFLAGIMVVGTLVAFATGYALLTRKAWGRPLAIVAAMFSLWRVPVGSLLGLYTLWVLAPTASGVEYAELSGD